MPVNLTGIDAADLDALAARIRSWLEEHLPAPWRQAALDGDQPALARILADQAVASAWYAELGESGLATPGWPVIYGGLGLAGDAAAVVTDELTRLRADRRAEAALPAAAHPGRAPLVPAVQLARRGLGPGVTAHQGGAGRQLLGGQRAESVELLLRPSRLRPAGGAHRPVPAQAPRHHLLPPGHARPRLEVRPLRQLNGSSEFGEVFFTDVVVPDTDRLGPEGLGWSVGISTLMQERSGLSGRPGVGPGQADALAVRARQTGASEDPVLRDRIMQAFITERALQMATVRAFAALGKAEPGAEGSIRKLTHAQLEVAFGLPRDRDPYADQPFEERPDD